LFSSLRCFKRRGQPYKPKTKQNETSKQKGLKPAFSDFMLNIQLLKKLPIKSKIVLLPPNFTDWEDK
jgi:hypothetical protein